MPKPPPQEHFTSLGHTAVYWGEQALQVPKMADSSTKTAGECRFMSRPQAAAPAPGIQVPTADYTTNQTAQHHH